MAITLHIELLHIAPSIWRRVVVPAEITLDELHPAIQGAFAWQDYHLHQFEIDGQGYGNPEINEYDPDEGFQNEQDVPLQKLVNVGSEFLYTYDFGDNWEHRIVVEKIQKREDQEYTFIPVCLAGERAAPPEDCGGPYSYPEFLEALQNPSNPEHEHLKRWSLNFEPEIFSTAQANSLIAALYTWHLDRKRKDINAAPY